MGSSRLKIFILGYIMLSVCLIAWILVAAIGSMNDIRVRSDFEHQVTDKLGVSLADARYESVQIQQYVTDSVATGENDGLEDAFKALKHAQQLLVEVSSLDPKLKEDAQKLSSALAQLHDTGLRMFAAYRKSREAGNRIMKATDGFDAQTEVIVKQLEQLSQRIDALQAKAVADQYATIDRSTMVIFTVGVLLSLLSIGAGGFLYQQVFAALGERDKALSSLTRVLSEMLDSSAVTSAQGNRDVAWLSSTIVQLIKDREQSHLDLQKAKEAAESSNRAKSEFLANMSHEIRTPMNGVIGLTRLSLEMAREPAQRKYLLTAISSASALMVILNEILDFSKIEAHQMKTEQVQFDLHALIQETHSSLEARAWPKGLQFAAPNLESVPKVVIGDPGRIRQVLNNLCDNAIKFTSEGHVSLTVCSEKSTQGPCDFTFSVADTGIGVPPEKTEQIFHAFSQADTSTTREFGGTGLGLTICARLVELMGGKIWLESQVGKGSTFHFVLPLPVVDVPWTPDTVDAKPRSGMVDPVGSESWSEQSDPYEGRPLQVLLVDDHPINQMVAKSILNSWGHSVTVADNGQIAVDMFPTAHWDIVLMDIQMPEMDGLEATTLIRKAGESGARVPIVAVTANASNEDKEATRAAGMDDFISKPFHYSELKNVLRKFCA